MNKIGHVIKRHNQRQICAVSHRYFFTGKLYQPQRVFTPADALEAPTLGAAAATLREDEVGRIASGARANLVVWDANPLSDAPEALLDTAAVLTLVDGAPAYDARS